MILIIKNNNSNNRNKGFACLIIGHFRTIKKKLFQIQTAFFFFKLVTNQEIDSLIIL